MTVERTTMLAIVRRHKLLFVVVLAITVGIVVYVERTVDHEYAATGSLLLVQPDAGAIGGQPVGDALLQEVMTRLAADGDGDVEAYSVDVDVFEISVRAPEAELARQSLEGAIAWARTEMEAVSAEAGLGGEERPILQAQVVRPPEVTGNGAFESVAEVWVDEPIAPANPYEAGPDTLELLRIAVISDAGQAALATELPQAANVHVEFDPLDEAPVLRVTTTAGSPPDALTAFERTRTFLVDELRQRQERSGVPPPERIELDTLASPLEATRTGRVPGNTSLVVIALGFVAACGLAALVEWW